MKKCQIKKINNVLVFFFLNAAKLLESSRRQIVEAAGFIRTGCRCDIEVNSLVALVLLFVVIVNTVLDSCTSLRLLVRL